MTKQILQTRKTNFAFRQQPNSEKVHLITEEYDGETLRCCFCAEIRDILLQFQDSQRHFKTKCILETGYPRLQGILLITIATKKITMSSYKYYRT